MTGTMNVVICYQAYQLFYHVTDKNESNQEDIVTNESPIEAPASSQNNKKTNSNKGKNKTRTPKGKGKDKSETRKATQPVKCDLCTSVFSNQGNYKRHRKIHTLNLKVHIHVI